MDKERLKKGHMFTDEYFERQLQYIREIRLAERKLDGKENYTICGSQSDFNAEIHIQEESPSCR